MGSNLGRRAVVVSSEVDTLRFQLNDDQQLPITLVSSSETVQILNAAGTEVIAATSTGLTLSGSTATYSRSWDTTNFPISSVVWRDDKSGLPQEFVFQAVWTLYDSTPTAYVRRQWFVISRRRFRTGLTEAEVLEIYPSISAQQTTGDLDDHIKHVWGEFERKLWTQHQLYPGNIFWPESFYDALHKIVAHRWYFDNAFDSDQDSEDWTKQENLEQRGWADFKDASEKPIIDWDLDGIMDDDERPGKDNLSRETRR